MNKIEPARSILVAQGFGSNDINSANTTALLVQKMAALESRYFGAFRDELIRKFILETSCQFQYENAVAEKTALAYYVGYWQAHEQLKGFAPVTQTQTGSKVVTNSDYKSTMPQKFEIARDSENVIRQNRIFLIQKSVEVFVTFASDDDKVYFTSTQVLNLGDTITIDTIVYTIEEVLIEGLEFRLSANPHPDSTLASYVLNI